MNSEAIIKKLSDAFGSVRRPAKLCARVSPEGEEHDRLMQKRTPATLAAHDVRPEWSPVGWLTRDAFKHFLPRLAEIALEDGREAWADDLLFWLDVKINQEHLALTGAEAEALVEYLEHLVEVAPPSSTYSEHWDRVYASLRPQHSAGGEA